ncbi:hypothetical protein [Phaeobacter italicus]|uniref:hypothetical protein n=1 Tax=Phaeobacter italicus TaxID=481446 RepID=UPI001CD68257|nr:hypothetical protein [Phaeobacter italicus]MCA0856162.1 hypothetical protein [Phaeobacter italicus]
MKIAEQFIDGDGPNTFHIKHTFDAQAALDQAAALRSAEATHMGESRLVAEVPMWLVEMWMKEAGVAHNDNAARQELLTRKLQSGEFSKFRVWEGSY